jgi:VanZ family protein
MTVIFGFAIACFDELHQNFVQGRHPSIDDLIFDFLGLILSFINYKNFY